MKIGEKNVEQIIVSGKYDEVLAIISDNEIVNITGVSVVIDYKD